MGFGVNISVKLGFPLNYVGLSPEGLAGFTWGGYADYTYSYILEGGLLTSSVNFRPKVPNRLLVFIRRLTFIPYTPYSA